MNVEIGTVAALFLFLEYLFQIFGIGSLQCKVEDQTIYLCNCYQTCNVCCPLLVYVKYLLFELRLKR
jgi:hypothetical protein